MGKSFIADFKSDYDVHRIDYSNPDLFYELRLRN